jgi:succinate dehydrogenase / fumarate reductase iron-sulfur subunit
VVKDLAVDRAFDRVMQAGGFILAEHRPAPQTPTPSRCPRPSPTRPLDAAATCIGCGACVASCKNGSAMLFVGAKINHLSILPQGQAEREPPRPRHGRRRWTRPASATAPTTASARRIARRASRSSVIAKLNRDYLRARAEGVLLLHRQAFRGGE